MIASAWHNGLKSASPSGYGLRISKLERDKHCDRNWVSVTLVLDDDTEVKVALSPAFWRKCSEFRSPQIGSWLLGSGHAPWPSRRPPRFVIEPIGDARFSVRRLDPH